MAGSVKCVRMVVLVVLSMMASVALGLPSTGATTTIASPSSSPSSSSSLSSSTTTTTTATDDTQPPSTKEEKEKEGQAKTSHAIPINNTDNIQDTPADNVQMAADFLWRYGYFRQGTSLGLLQGAKSRRRKRATKGSHGGMTRALRSFQRYFGLEPTGRLDSATLRLMKRKRCGVADMVLPVPRHHRAARAQRSTSRDSVSQSGVPSDYVFLGSKWEKTTLTWRLEKPSRQFHSGKQRETFRRAFDVWRDVAPLNFVEKPNQKKVDIVIKFGVRRHGDGYPFDGKGKVLAHAFGPGTDALSGDMHIDDEERWSLEEDEDYGTSDLYLVSAHELGHSLGLAHSTDPKALMYPYYGLTDTLGDDDVRAIQILYGARMGGRRGIKPRRRRPTTTTTPRPGTRFPWAKSATYIVAPPPSSSPRPQCQRHFDVIILDDAENNHVYTGIDGQLVYRFNKAGLIGGYPCKLDSLYPGAPTNADAVFTLPGKPVTFFIKGYRVWRFQNSRLQAGFPRDLNRRHFTDGIRFVITHVDTENNLRIFVFGATKWMEYNFDRPPRKKPQTYPLNVYARDLPANVRYAVRGYDNDVYLMLSEGHVIMDGFRRSLIGGRKSGYPYWLRPVCQPTRSSGLVYWTSTAHTLSLSNLLIFLSLSLATLSLRPSLSRLGICS